MRMILLAGMALAVSACGGGETNQANTMATDNVMLDENMMMDPNMAMDPNMSVDPNMSMNGANAMGANGSVDANTRNMMMQDANTNDPDTNLANGM